MRQLGLSTAYINNQCHIICSIVNLNAYGTRHKPTPSDSSTWLLKVLGFPHLANAHALESSRHRLPLSPYSGTRIGTQTLQVSSLAVCSL